MASGARGAGRSWALVVDGETVELTAEDVLIQTAPRTGFAVAAADGITVAVDTVLSVSLQHEGLAREVIRRIQNLRKEAGFAIEDRIVTEYAADKEMSEAIQAFAGLIRDETLSVSLAATSSPSGEMVQTDTVDERGLILGLRRATG